MYNVFNVLNLPLWQGVIFWEKDIPGITDTPYRQLCKNGWTDRDAVCVVDSAAPKKACITWGAHWRHLANTIESSVCDGGAAFLSIYFACLL